MAASARLITVSGAAAFGQKRKLAGCYWS